MVATDRISAYDVVMNEPIPNKGKVLTQLSLFWFDFLKDIVPNHLITHLLMWETLLPHVLLKKNNTNIYSLV